MYMNDVGKAASLMGRKSAEARIKKWGKKEFVSFAGRAQDGNTKLKDEISTGHPS